MSVTVILCKFSFIIIFCCVNRNFLSLITSNFIVGHKTLIKVKQITNEILFCDCIQHSVKVTEDD